MSDFYAVGHLAAARNDLMLRDAREAALDAVIGIANGPGNWDATEYHRGMANGLLLAQAIIKGGSPEYREPVGKALEVAELGAEFDEVAEQAQPGPDNTRPKSPEGQTVEAALATVTGAVHSLDKALADMRDAVEAMPASNKAAGTNVWNAAIDAAIKKIDRAPIYPRERTGFPDGERLGVQSTIRGEVEALRKR